MIRRVVQGNIVKTLRCFQLLFASPSEKRHALVGRPHVWQMKRDFQIQFLKQVGLHPDHYLLDYGCGTLRGGIPIIEYLFEGHYCGIDVRATVLDEGKKELHEAGLESKKPVLILADDISTLDLQLEFDFIWAYSVLIHLSDDILEKTLKFISEHLKLEGVFFANVNLGQVKDSYWHQNFPLVWRRIEFYKDMASHHGLQVSDMGSVAGLGFKSGMKDHDQQHMLKFTNIKDNFPKVIPNNGSNS
jgi:SAM-dependent methyltransferase